MDVYGYCLDDPINFVDRTGLAQAHERRLKGLEFLDEPSGTALKKAFHAGTPVGRLTKAFPGAVDWLMDKGNVKLKHEFIKYDKADLEKKEKTNSGFSKGGVRHDENGVSTPIGEHFDDKVMRQAEKNIEASGKYKKGKYKEIGNNCQDYTKDVTKEYQRIQKKE